MISFTIPIKLVSPNVKEHWTKPWKRNEINKLLIKSMVKGKKLPVLPVMITITRIAPKPYDARDNLRMACKGLIDILADIMIPGLPPGHADSDTRLEFDFVQEKGKPKEYAIKIEIKSYWPEPIVV